MAMAIPKTRYIIMIVAIIIIIYTSIMKSKTQVKLEAFYNQLSDVQMVEYNDKTKHKLDLIESDLKSILGVSTLNDAMTTKIDPVIGKINEIKKYYKKNNEFIMSGTGKPTYSQLNCNEIANRKVPIFNSGTNLNGINKIVNFCSTKQPATTNPNNKQSLITFGLNIYQRSMDTLCTGIKALNKQNKEVDKPLIKSPQCIKHKYGNDKCII